MPKPDSQRTGDVASVLYFLRFAAEDGMTFNCTTGREAFDAFARLLGQDPDTLWERTTAR